MWRGVLAQLDVVSDVGYVLIAEHIPMPIP